MADKDSNTAHHHGGPKGLDITGLRSGKLVAQVLIAGSKPRRWDCLCDCGNHTPTLQAEMVGSHAKSCGCVSRGGRPKMGQEPRSRIVQCAHCGAELKKQLARVKRSAHFFCSSEHWREFIKANPPKRPELYKMLAVLFKGEKSPRWKGGKEASKIVSKAWRERNYDRLMVLKANRRARQRNAPGSFTLEEWVAKKAEFGNCCAHCRRPESEVKLTRDHIIPLIKGGWNSIDNIAPLCLSCNCHKKDKLPPDASPDGERRARIEAAIEAHKNRPKPVASPEQAKKRIANMTMAARKQSPLSVDDVRKIKPLRYKKSSRVVGDMFGVNKSTIKAIWAGRNWADVEPSAIELGVVIEDPR